MFRRILLPLLLGLVAVAAHAQTDAFQGFCNRGGQFAVVSGLNSSNRLQNVIPSCTVTVYYTGTTTLVPANLITKDAGGTPLGNPFTADAITSLTPGHWLFYAADGQGYDVVGSGGITPNTYPAPVTLCTDCKVGAGSGPGNLTVEVNSVPISPPSPANFVNTASVTVAFVGDQIQMTATGSTSNCQGSISGDNTSTDCGYHNRVGDTATTPADIQTFGYTNLGTNSADQVIALGNNNAAANGISESVWIGDTNGTSIPLNGTNPTSVVSIGEHNMLNLITPSFPHTQTDLIVIGDTNMANSGCTLCIIMGNGAGDDMFYTGSSTNWPNDIIAIGDGAGSAQVNSSSLIAIGNGAGTGANGDEAAMLDVVSIGDQPSFKFNGDDEVAIGDASGSLYAQPSTDIVAIGDGSGNGVDDTATVVHDVVAIGDRAAHLNSGNDVVAIGDGAMGVINGSTSSGNENVAIGELTMGALTSGAQNVAIGGYAGANGVGYPSTVGFGNRTGSQNTWLGYNAGPNTATQLSNTIGIGYQAYNTASNQTVIGNSSITSLKLFGCPTGEVVYDDGSGTCVTPGGGGGGDTIASPGSTLTVGGTSTATTLDVANAATFNNSGSGAASGTTYNGSAARTISYNTLGAQQALTLTTTGTSGPATLSGGALNIPQYSSGGGSGTVSGQANGVIPLATASTVIGAQSHLDDGNTTAGTITSTEPVAVAASGLPTQETLTYNSGHTPTVGASGNFVLAPDSSGDFDVSEAGAAFARVCTATNGICTGSGGGYTNVIGSAGQTTVALINTACSGGTLYATTPLSIATGGTITCPVQKSQAGVWTIASGQTVTFGSTVTETDGATQFFAGSGTVVFGNLVTVAPVEWFGASTSASASVNLAAVNACLNALTAGQCTQNQLGNYQINGSIVVPKSGVGLSAPLNTTGGTQTILGGSSSASCWQETSASADVIQIIGTSSVYLNNNWITRICQSRTVPPSGTAAGISVQYTVKTFIDQTTLADNINQIYCLGCANSRFQRIWGYWGYNGIASYTTGLTLTGIDYDTSTGVSLQSAVAIDDTFLNITSGNHMTGITDIGDLIADLNITHVETAGADYGAHVDDLSVTTGSSASFDVHFSNCIFDGEAISAYLIQNINQGQNGAVKIEGGEASSFNNSTHPVIDIENSTGVTIGGGIQLVPYNNTPPELILINGAGGNNIDNVITHNPGLNMPALVLNNTVKNNIGTFSPDQPYPGGTTNTAIVLTSASHNTLQFNIKDYGAVGVSADASSNNNMFWGEVAPTVTTPFTDAGTGNCWFINGAFTGCSGISGLSGMTAGQVPIAATATTVTSSIPLGNSGSDIPQLSSGLLSPSVLPLATTSAFGAIKPDGSSCTTTAGVLSCPGGTGATSVPICSDSSGSGTAQSCTTSPTFTPTSGSVIVYSTTTANTGTGLMINVNSLGAKSVAKWQGTTTLAANDILAGKYILMTYDGTNWESSTIGNAPSGGGGNWVNIGSSVTWTASGSMAGSFSGGAFTVSTAGTVLTISGIPGTYLNLMIKGQGTTASQSLISVQFNSDTGSHYSWSGSNLAQTAPSSLGGCGGTGSTTSITCIAGLGSLAGQFTDEIQGYTSTTYPKVIQGDTLLWGALSSSGTNQRLFGYGLWDPTSQAAITSITLTCVSNCSVGDTFEIYATN